MYCVFFGDSDRLDKIHASRMIGIDEQIRIYEVTGGDHNAARKMRDSGMFQRLCDSILAMDKCDVDSILRPLDREHSIRQYLSPDLQ
jgi:hypothetical protein